MTYSYLKVISKYYPGTAVSITGDETDYNNIEWHDTPISQADLDNKMLDYGKSIRLKEIDTRTGELITQGFIYDNTQFSLSVLAQTNWIGLKQAAQNNLITYPFAISTMDDGEYQLDDITDVTDFYVAGLGTKITLLSSGRALKLQIKNATTMEELDAVVDNR